MFNFKSFILGQKNLLCVDSDICRSVCEAENGVLKYAANFPSDEVYLHRTIQYSTVRPSLLAKYNISDMEKYNIEEDRKRLAEDILKMLEQGSLNDVKIKLSDG